MQTHLLDFERARLSWTTRDGTHGDWRVIAMAERWASEVESTERFFLAPTVMAGNVFGPGPLPLSPPYSFQIIASSDRHIIIREAAAGSARGDTSGTNETTFSSVTLHAPQSEGTLLDFETLQIEEIHGVWPLSARITTRRVGGEWWTVQFPVNHINSSGAAASAIQVETGPLVLPHAWLPDLRAERLGPFVLCYLFFRTSHEVEVLALQVPADGHPRMYSSAAPLTGVSVELCGRSKR
jgi:hypothetical protein